MNNNQSCNQFLCKRVTSSAFTLVAYNPITKTLRLFFKTGTLIDYFPVDRHIFDNMLESESIGTSYHVGIKKNFSSAKISTEESTAFLTAFEQAEKHHLIPVSLDII